jgi:hypothetical protein
MLCLSAITTLRKLLQKRCMWRTVFEREFLLLLLPSPSCREPTAAHSETSLTKLQQDEGMVLKEADMGMGMMDKRHGSMQE